MQQFQDGGSTISLDVVRHFHLLDAAVTATALPMKEIALRIVEVSSVFPCASLIVLTVTLIFTVDINSLIPFSIFRNILRVIKLKQALLETLRLFLAI